MLISGKKLFFLNSEYNLKYLRLGGQTLKETNILGCCGLFWPIHQYLFFFNSTNFSNCRPLL